MQWRDLEVLHVERPSDANVMLRLGVDPPGSLPFVAGQFVYVQRPGDGPDVKSAYSIASPPYENDRIELCIKKVEGGATSTWLYEREAGARLKVSRAFGGFRFRSPPGRDVALLATGTGVAPLRSILLDRLRAGDDRRFWLYYGVGREVNLVYGDELRELAGTRPNFRYVPIVSRASAGWPGERGWIQEPFLRDFAGRADYDAYVCGVKRMVDDVLDVLKSKGLAEGSIHFEKYV